jgi:hypothetical protein
MNRLCRAGLLAGIVCTALCGVIAAWGQAMSQPKLPYVTENSCPGEYCTFGSWKILTATSVYDTWQAQRQQNGKIAAGEMVVATIGIVITFKPEIIRVDRPLPNENLDVGDTILTYGYMGEGFSDVWFKGKYYSDFDISFAKWPDGTGCGGVQCAATYVDLGAKQWWVHVKLQSGKIGWVDMTNVKFEGGKPGALAL